MSGVVGRTFRALRRRDVKVIAIAQGSSECTVSFVVSQNDVRTALRTAHREFQLGSLNSKTLPPKNPKTESAAWFCESDRPSANADRYSDLSTHFVSPKQIRKASSL
jgi:hypothetical protein